LSLIFENCDLILIPFQTFSWKWSTAPIQRIPFFKRLQIKQPCHTYAPASVHPKARVSQWRRGLMSQMRAITLFAVVIIIIVIIVVGE
jgi:hypothetical protein